jgi:hypothetical protein
MSEWIFQAILTMLVGSLFMLFLIKKSIVPPDTSVFELQKNIIEESSLE